MGRARGRTLWLALSALAACLAFLWFARGGGRTDAPRSVAPAAPLPARPAPPQAPPLTEEPAPRALAVEGAAPEPEPAAAAPEAPLAPRPLAAELAPVTGAAVRVDRLGAEHAGDDGGFTVGWSGETGFERRELEVLDGRFAAELPLHTPLYVTDLTLAGETLVVEERELALSDERFLLVRGRELAAVVLHVVSTTDRAPLEELEVYAARGSSLVAAWTHPGELTEAPVATAPTSPVLVPARADWRGGESAYWVRARGHAFGRVALDHGSSGERTLALPPEAALEVELLGLEDWLEPLVRLYTPDARPWEGYSYAERAPDAAGIARFDALAPGRYRVSVERGWADRARRFGEAQVELLAGEEARVRVELELPEEPREVRVEGTLALGEGWSAEGLRLELEAQGAASVWSDGALDVALEPSGEGRFDWGTELPCAGVYEVTAAPRLGRWQLEVPAEGLADVALEVAPAAEVEARVVDDATGEELAVESLCWSPPRLQDVTGTPIHTAARDETRGAVVFRAPAGPVILMPADPSLALVGPRGKEGHRVLAPGLNRVELRAERRMGVRLTFRDGEALVPWSWSWGIGARRIGAGRGVVARSIGVLWFAEEGRYELTSEGIPGFQSVDGTPFEVRRGAEELELEVELRRE